MTEMNTPSKTPKTPGLARQRVRRSLPWGVGTIAFLVLAAPIAYIGLRPQPVIPPAPDLTPMTNRIAGLATAITRVQDGLGTVSAKLTTVEQKLSALPAPPDIAPLEQQLGALEKRVATIKASASAHGTTASAASAEASAASLAPLEARLGAIEKAAAHAQAVDTARAAEQAAQGRTLATLEQSVGALTQSGTHLADHLAALTHLAQATSAAAALRDGRPLGTIPGAPPALVRYANNPPPTLSSLRLAFAEAVPAQLALASNGREDQGFVDQVRERLGSLITVRRGDKVIVGNPAAGAIAQAKAALGAGDLRGALDALGALSPLAPAMTIWMANARGLLAAEAAIATFGKQD